MGGGVCTIGTCPRWGLAPARSAGRAAHGKTKRRQRSQLHNDGRSPKPTVRRPRRLRGGGRACTWARAGESSRGRALEVRPCGKHRPPRRRGLAFVFRAGVVGDPRGETGEGDPQARALLRRVERRTSSFFHALAAGRGARGAPGCRALFGAGGTIRRAFQPGPRQHQMPELNY